MAKPSAHEHRCVLERRRRGHDTLTFAPGTYVRQAVFHIRLHCFSNRFIKVLAQRLVIVFR
jgi:hypothetical protein